MLIVRENSEGLYSGRERVRGDTAITERVVTRQASERIARVACEQALKRAQARERAARLTVVHKANVLKKSGGLFRESVLRIADGYADITIDDMLVDAAAMQLIKSPQTFDVLVTSNLFGDILSDAASALVGGLGVSASANLGDGTPVFEPVHGSAPDIVGRGIANPVGTLLSAALMLAELGRGKAARRLELATLSTLSEGILTPDLGGECTTVQVVEVVCQRVRERAC